MDAVMSGPPIDKNANWDEETAWNHEGNAEFGTARVGVPSFQCTVHLGHVSHGKIQVGSENWESSPCH